MSGRTELRVVIADEDEAGRRRLESLVSADSLLDLVETCKRGEQAVAAIKALRPDLVLLDVQMTELSGFDVLAAAGPELTPAVIFVAGHERFAVQAFDADAVDYLLKPFNDARFSQAISRARERLGYRFGAHTQSPADPVSRDGPQRLFVRVRNQCKVLDAPDVDWLEACDNYVRLHVAEQVFTMRAAISSLAQRLSPRQFMRIHRSTMVNVDRIRRVETHHQTDFALTLHNGVRLTSGRAYRNNIRAFLQGM